MTNKLVNKSTNKWLPLIPGINPEFKTSLKTLTEHVFDPKNIVIKEINGKQITGRELFQYFRVMMIKLFQLHFWSACLELPWLFCLNFLCLNVLYVRALCGYKYTLSIHHPHPYHYCDNMQERNPFGQPACSKRMLKISSYQKCIRTLNIILKV